MKIKSPKLLKLNVTQLTQKCLISYNVLMLCFLTLTSFECGCGYYEGEIFEPILYTLANNSSENVYYFVDEHYYYDSDKINFDTEDTIKLLEANTCRKEMLYSEYFYNYGFVIYFFKEDIVRTHQFEEIMSEKMYERAIAVSQDYFEHTNYVVFYPFINTEDSIMNGESL